MIIPYIFQVILRDYTCIINTDTYFKANHHNFTCQFLSYFKSTSFSLSIITELLNKGIHNTVERVNVQGKPKNDSLIYLRETGDIHALSSLFVRDPEKRILGTF